MNWLKPKCKQYKVGPMWPHADTIHTTFTPLTCIMSQHMSSYHTTYWVINMCCNMSVWCLWHVFSCDSTYWSLTWHVFWDTPPMYCNTTHSSVWDMTHSSVWHDLFWGTRVWASKHLGVSKKTKTPVLSQKSPTPTFYQKRLTFTQKSLTFCQKSPKFYQKSPTPTFQEPYTKSKEPHLVSKEPHIHTCW